MVAVRTTPLVGFAEVGFAVAGFGVAVTGRAVVGVVGFDDVGFAVVGFAVVGFAVTGMDVGFAVGVFGQVSFKHRPYPPESICVHVYPSQQFVQS